MQKDRHTFGDISKRIALPFFLFATVLLFLLLLSWYLLIPSITQVEVGGSVRDLQELKAYKADLEAQIVTFEQKRGEYLMPSDSDLFDRLKGMKSRSHTFQPLRREVYEIAKSLVPDQPNAIALTQFLFDSSSRQVELHGRVHNVGPRSMTVLAQFVEALGRIEIVGDIKTSRYTRLQDGEDIFYSPFVLRLSITAR